MYTIYIQVKSIYYIDLITQPFINGDKSKDNL